MGTQAGERGYQLRYSDLQPLMSDEASRRRKARKIIAVLRDALAPRPLGELRLLDVGASTGIITGELGRVFGEVVGMDVDEPGIEKAKAYLTGPNQTLLLADGLNIPFEDEHFDVLVLNHVYEHVPDPQRLFGEMRRVLRPDGVLYFAADNRLTLIEPHYRLPALSWLPPRGADLYLKATGRGDHYYERLRTYGGLLALARGFRVEDYTLRILGESARFAAEDMIRPGSPASRVPTFVWRLARPLLPTYVFVLRKR